MRTLDDAALEANFAAVKGTIGCDRVAELEMELRRSGGLLKGRARSPTTRTGHRASTATRTATASTIRGTASDAPRAGTSWISGRPSRDRSATWSWPWKTSPSTSA